MTESATQSESYVLEPSLLWRNLVGALVLAGVFIAVVAGVEAHSSWPVFLVVPLALAVQLAVVRFAPRVRVSVREASRRRLASLLFLALLLLALLLALFSANVP